MNTVQQEGGRVQQYFASEAPYWKDVYQSSDIFSTIIQRRHAIALAWIDRLALAPMTPVLEVGCGAGLLSVALCQRNLAVQAVDPVPAMVAQARRCAAGAGLGGHLRVDVGDAHALGFETATFQLVTALGVLPWLHSPGQAVREMARVLKPGGWLIISADNWARLIVLLDPARNPLLNPLKRTVKRALLGARALEGCRPRADRHADVDRMLRPAGLSVVDRTTCGFGPLTIVWQRFLPNRLELAMERRLQALADRRVPGIRSLGWHSLVLAKRN